VVPVVAEGRREPLRSNHSDRAGSGCGSDLFFWNLEATKIVKLLHATALALVVWYLMLPPSTSLYTFDAKAPISKWIDFMIHDSARQCENALTDYRDKMSRNAFGAAPPLAAEQIAEFRVAQCVSTDDPRLEGVPYNSGVTLGHDGPQRRTIN
jgi:hypothetical protein